MVKNKASGILNRKKQKVMFVLPHTFEFLFPKIKEDIKNIANLDHFSTRYLDFMQRHTNKYEFEFWVLSSKIKKPVSIRHKHGFVIRAFPTDFPSFLPLETSRSMLNEISSICKSQSRERNGKAASKQKPIWHLNSYYLIMSDFLSASLKKNKQAFCIQHRGGGFTLKALPYSVYKYWLMNPIVFRRASLVVPENRDEEKRLLNNYRLPREKVIYAPNPVEIISVKQSKQELRKKLGLPLNKSIILYAGRLMKGKGVVHLFDAMKNHLRNDKGLVFLMIGDGDSRQRIEQMIAQEKLDNARVINWVSREKLFEYYGAADLFVHPNMNTKFEGTPNALVEAQGSGLPIVGFDVGGVHDIVKHSYCGELEKTKDMERFAARIVALSKKSSLLRKMSNNARKNYEDNYSSDKILKTYEKIYELVNRL
ncbi:glycosyltransferase family 4 protein [Candidatus Woesearchaeota archaeon]|nr:glycosyltransferase family 4 protein [Candidatus Woesearchaeota archaeon]